MNRWIVEVDDVMGREFMRKSVTQEFPEKWAQVWVGWQVWTEKLP